MTPQNSGPEIKKSTNISEYKKAGFALFLIAGAVALVIIVAYPLYNNYQTNTTLIEQEKAKITELDTRLSQLDKIKRIAGSIESTGNLTKQAVSVEDEIPVVMAMVQEIAKKSGVKISDFSYAGMESSKPQAAATTTSGISDPKAQPTGSVLNNSQTPTTPVANPKIDYDIFKMQLAVKGKFSDLKQLVLNLENYRRVLDIQSFTYGVQTGDTEVVGDTLLLKVTLASYFKDFKTISTNVDLEQYNTLIKKLESLTYTEIDLSNPNIGKIDPFSSISTPVPTPSGTPAPGVNNVEPSSFYNNKSNSNEVNVIELEGTGKTVTTTPEPDVEAAPGDTTKLLQDLMKQEGL